MAALSLNLVALLAPCVLAPTEEPPELATKTIQTRFVYKAMIPESKGSLRVWIPVPSDNPNQKVSRLVVDRITNYRITTESQYRNRMVFVDFPTGTPAQEVTVSFDVKRTTAQSGTQGEVLARFRQRDRLVPIDGKFSEMAVTVAGSRLSAEAKIRAIYENTLANMQYDYKKESPKLGDGDVAFVCDYKKGNCSDLHSYMISLTRAQGIPAYLEYGFPITGIPKASPVPLTGKITGYHCWMWAHVPSKGWMPIDASDGRRWADAKRNDVSDGLCGKLVVERSAVAVSRGRDITLEPRQQAGSVNNFIYPYGEEDGKRVEVKWELSYENLAANQL